MFTDDPKALQGSLIGFINPNGYYPSAIIVVYKNDDKFFQRFPSCEAIELSEKAFEETLEFDNYFPVHEKRTIQEDEYAFAISQDQIIIDTHNNIMDQLKRLLSESPMNEIDSELITQYINNTQ